MMVLVQLSVGVWFVGLDACLPVVGGVGVACLWERQCRLRKTSRLTNFFVEKIDKAVRVFNAWKTVFELT